MSGAMEEIGREMDSMLGSFGMRDPFASPLFDPFLPDEDLTPNVIRRSFPVSGKLAELPTGLPRLLTELCPPHM